MVEYKFCYFCSSLPPVQVCTQEKYFSCVIFRFNFLKSFRNMRLIRKLALTVFSIQKIITSQSVSLNVIYNAYSNQSLNHVPRLIRLTIGSFSYESFHNQICKQSPYIPYKVAFSLQMPATTNY